MSVLDLQSMLERNEPVNLPYASDGSIQLTPEEKAYFSRQISKQNYASGGQVFSNLTPEQLEAWKKNAYYNNDYDMESNNARYLANQGGEGAGGLQGSSGFTGDDLGGDMRPTYDAQGNFTGVKHFTPWNFIKDFAIPAAVTVGGTILGAGALNGALAGGAASGAVGADAATSAAWGSGAGLGGDTLGAMGMAPELAAGGSEAGGLLSKAALDGTTAFGANSVPGALEVGSYAGTAIPSAVDLGSTGGIASTGASGGSLSQAGTTSAWSGLGDKAVAALTNPANLIKYGPAALGAVSAALSSKSQPETGAGGSSGPKDTRSLTQWDWDKIQAAAKAANMPMSQFLATQWNNLTDTDYNKSEVKLARGGALNRFAQGAGSGRDDTIDAKLSDGEYVFDAETTALIGDGSAREGAKRLDAMRENIRKHKGKALARGKISPDAKSPLQYIKEST
jgi:hypothetical protein